MTTIQEVRSVLPVGGYGASIDLKDAYWHVPIHPRFRKYLGFSLGGIKYCFKALPFGLNIAPRIFTKISKAILKEVRRRGVLALVYIDDWLVWGPSYQECRRAVQIVLEVLEKRGFIVNMTKSCLTPNKVIQWLGVTWNLSLIHI